LLPRPKVIASRPFDGETTIGVGKSVEVVAFTPPSSVHVREAHRPPGVRSEEPR